MASTSGSVPYPTSTPDDTSSDLSSGTGATSGTGSASSAGSASANGSAATMGGSSMQPVVERVAERAHRVVDELAGRAAPAVDRLRSTVTEAKDSMGRRMEDLSHTREEWMDSARESVRRNPLAAVGLAAAVGFLLARLTSHER